MHLMSSLNITPLVPSILFIRADCNLEIADPCKPAVQKMAICQSYPFNEEEAARILPMRLFFLTLFIWQLYIVFVQSTISLFLQNPSGE